MINLYGYLLEFANPEDLVRATDAVCKRGFKNIEPFSPFPIEALTEVLPARKNYVPMITLIGGIVGAVSGYALQYYASVVAYPINVGNRPLHSWPAFIPITFEMTILFAALSSVTGMMLLNGLPLPYHPVFNAPQFQLATKNRFFLCIEATDPRVQSADDMQFVKSLGQLSFVEVPK